jgi:hypothetical protein
MNRGRRNLLLLVGITLLAGLWWFTREQAEPERPLTALNQDSIDRIRVEHSGRPAIALNRDAGGNWRLDEPVKADADAFEVAALLNLAALPVRRTLDAGYDAAELGLAPPAYVITLNDIALRFGDTNPITAQRVIETETGGALVDNPPSAALDDDYSDLVSKQLIPEGDEIVAIALPDGRQIEAADDGWRVVGFPALDPQALVAGWQGVRAMWNAMAPAIDATELEQVTIRLASGATLAFQVIQRAPQFELVNPVLKVQYTLSAVLADTLLTVPEPEPAVDAATPAKPVD